MRQQSLMTAVSIAHAPAVGAPQDRGGRWARPCTKVLSFARVAFLDGLCHVLSIGKLAAGVPQPHGNGVLPLQEAERTRLRRLGANIVTASAADVTALRARLREVPGRQAVECRAWRGAFAQDSDGEWGPRGQLRGTDQRRIAIDGLWALQFGHGAANNGPTTTLFFTAGPNDEEDGLFGSITTG